MTWVESVYESALRASRPVLRVAAVLDGKVGRGVAGRRAVVARLQAWASSARDLRHPLFWFHAPSVGEALMAQATIGALRASCPQAQVAFTFFSPSAERVAARVGADVSDYLPWDIGAEVGAAIDALRPSSIAFVRTEIWPVATREAAARGVPLVLVNAVLGPGSSRLRPGARRLLTAAYARLARVGAVAREDAERFARLGVEPDRVRVTGDARFDQVAARVGGIDRDSALLRAFAARDPLVVAGSTWPADEAVLVPAFARAGLLARARLAIAPHEPTPRHIEGLARTLAAAGLAHERLSAVERRGRADARITIIDRVGVLADLYAAGALAYVGGGFGHHGLHSVIEPAALGIPVLFGPRHGNAREASELRDAGGGFEVVDVADCADRLTALLADPAPRARAGGAAAAYVRSRLGGAAANAALILEASTLTGSATGA